MSLVHNRTSRYNAPSVITIIRRQDKILAQRGYMGIHTTDSETAIGICLGASTFSLVEIERNGAGPEVKNIVVREHDGDPKGALTAVLDTYTLDNRFIAVTGRKFREITRFPSIIEPEATELAYSFTQKGESRHDAVVSAGGESFIVYQLDRMNRVSRISSGNKCASGTGEFFMQQIRRMNVNIEEAVALAGTSTEPHELSGRCSVFCKSDCTHALNKGESVADVAAGLARMIAKKISELLVKISARKVMVVGGTARNPAVIGFLKKEFDRVDVPEEAPYFEALGAALWALETRSVPEGIPATETEPADGSPARHYFKDSRYSFDFLKPLSRYEDMVEFKTMPYGTVQAGDDCIIGLDVGSTTTKAVLFRRSDRTMLCSSYLRTNGNPVEASRNCYRALLEQLQGVPIKISGLGVTGSGRYIAGLHAGTDGIVNEIIAHARAATEFDPQVDTIYEIGGQDAKYTFLTNAVASDYAMNEACSAGTGSFLEESAYESLGVRMEDIADVALKAQSPPNFSDQCAAFISSDINTALQEGISREDIVAGLVYSICINYVNRVKGSRQTGRRVFMQGGVCYNRAVPLAMAAISGKQIIVPPEPGLMGAYGVALEIQNMLFTGLLQPAAFALEVLADREVSYGKSFVCAGGTEKCDRKCRISVIEIDGKKFPFGGACNKYYNQVHRLSYDVTSLNHPETRKRLLFETFVTPREDLPDDAIVVGINKSFHTHLLYPLYFNFFDGLGCRVVLPENVRQSGIDKGMTSYCLAGQIALGMFEDLLEYRPDYIFSPQIKELHVSDQEEYRIEYQTTCMFVQGEPWYQKATHLVDRENPPELLAPVLDLRASYGDEPDAFADIAVQLGFTREEGLTAHRRAVEKQMEFFAACKAEGKRILEDLEAHPERVAVVYFGHPYSAFADEANKGVPTKFASRGIELIPFDFLPYEEEENYRDTYWEMGQRIIKAARIVERHPQLFGCYLTNFLCAIDSMMVTHFRDLMGTKPSLTIEVDSHTADAGVNTRIEAFMDVVRNYIRIRDGIEVVTDVFRPACTQVNSLGKTVFVDSAGETFRMNDPRVTVVVPSMGDLFSIGAAAILRSLGWNATALPVCDREALDMGRAVTTSKECLPIINILGQIRKYLAYRTNPEEKLVILMVGAGGCCRVGQYKILIDAMIEKHRLRDVAQLILTNDDGYAGLGLSFRLGMLKALYAYDVMDDIRSALKAHAADPDTAIEIFYREVRNVEVSIDGSGRVGFFKQLRKTARTLRQIPLKIPISEAKYVAVVGEIFVRRDHFALMGIPDQLAAHGFTMLDAPVSEWIRYTDFLRAIGMYEARLSFMGKIEMALTKLIQTGYERKIKKILEKSGLYELEMIDIERYMKHSTHFFPLQLTGEPGLSSGAALARYIEKYCGVISVGPFGCMNSRMTEAVAEREMTIAGKERAARNAGEPVNLSDLKDSTDVLPFLSIECDGNPFSQIIQARLETFLLQADRLNSLLKQRVGK
jgi:predicted CoA-substrate-specific enzyme activase